jgi:hypothetical protein
MIVRKGLRDFLSSRTGKVIPILLIALLIAAASSTVYVYYVANNTATVRAADLRLYAGKDASASCSAYPCATVSVSSTFDYATVGFSIFPSVTNSPQPATYYSNLTVIKNVGATGHTINSIKLSNFAGLANLAASPNGGITVWYCTTQTEFNPDGTLVTPGNCVGSAAIYSGSSGVLTLTGFPSALAASAKGYIELYGSALNTAAIGNTVTFNVSFQWV